MLLWCVLFDLAVYGLAVAEPALGKSVPVKPVLVKPVPVKSKVIEIPITTTANIATNTAIGDSQNAEAVKKMAIYDGQKQAFYQVINKLSPNNARNIYRNLIASKQGKEDLNEYLVSYTINREVAKDGSYEADIIYRFNAEKINNIIGIEQQNDDDADPTGDGLLIIPVYDMGNQILLFEKGNQWRYALNDVALEVGRGDFVMPFGDVRDQNMLNPQSVIAGEKQSLASMARRYGTRNVVIAYAKISSKASATATTGIDNSLQVKLWRAGEAAESLDFNFKQQSSFETLEAMLKRAANVIALKLKKQKADYSLFGESKANQLKAIVVRAEFTNGKQWRYMLDSMRGLPNLERLDLGAVGVQMAQATILYKGDAQIIRKSLLERGFEINDMHEYWVVHVPSSMAR